MGGVERGSSLRDEVESREMRAEDVVEDDEFVPQSSHYEDSSNDNDRSAPTNSIFPFPFLIKKINYFTRVQINDFRENAALFHSC